MQNTFGTMTSFIEKNQMKTAEGYKRGNKKKKCQDFIGMPLIKTKNFQANYIEEASLSRLDFQDFECTVENCREVFKAPHLIIKQSHQNGRFLSEVLDYDAAFNHSFLGVHGNMAMLKYLSVLIGSKVFSYYHILTNRKWLVERDELEAGDIWQTPIPIPTDREVEEACNIFDELIEMPRDNQKAEAFVHRMYRLKEYEVSQINDVIDYVYDYFKNKRRSASFKSPSVDDYQLFYTSLRTVLSNTFGTSISFSGELYFGNAPLTVLVLNLTQQGSASLNILTDAQCLSEILKKLDDSLLSKQEMIYVRRNLRIYQKDRIYIIKPTQRKYWTQSVAYRDADEIFQDISKAWR